MRAGWPQKWREIEADIAARTPMPVVNKAIDSDGENGRGLDSEWQGEVRIKEEVKQPSVAGALSVVRAALTSLENAFN